MMKAPFKLVILFLLAAIAAYAQPPTVKFGYTSNYVCFGQAVDFHDSSTATTGLTYEWDFGDFTTSSLKNPSHLYKEPGKYVVQLTILDSNYADTVFVTADSSLLTNVSFTTGCPCNSISFFATGNAQRWKWEFGNGDTSSLQNPVYIFQKPEKTIVKVTGYNTTTNCSFTKTIPITICGDDIVKTSKSNNRWYIGGEDHCGGTSLPSIGINFNTNPPSPLLDGAIVYAAEGSATVSDPKTGELLFYTSGETVWNKSHLVMSNGNNLQGRCSSSQEALIVPFPGNYNKYFIFTSQGSTAGFGGYYYSIVDMSLNGGLGQVVVKNIPILTFLTGFNGVPHECMSACEKPTSCDENTEYWFVIPAGLDRFHSYLITDAGFNNTPVVSNFPNKNLTNIQGCSVFSPDGKKFALNQNILSNVYNGLGTYPCLGVYDFNANTGKLSNRQEIRNWFIVNTILIQSIPFGIAFSPDNTKLYASSSGQLMQYDLTKMDIERSKYKVDRDSPGHQENIYGSLYLGPDDKIYLSNGRDSISIINNPNDSKASCNFNFNGISMAGRRIGSGTQNILPLEPITLDSLHANFSWEANCSEQMVTFRNLSDSLATPATCSFNWDDTLAYSWDFGDSSAPSQQRNPSHVYTTKGTYIVSLTVERLKKCLTNTFTGTVSIADTVPLSPIDKEGVTCNEGEIVLTAKGAISYLWSNGKTSSQIIVPPDNMLYSVLATNVCGTSKDSILIDADICSDRIYISNSFTPNGDGINDIYLPKGIRKDKPFQMLIYNRWGQLLFETKDTEEGWNGLIKKQHPAQQDVYMYKIVYAKREYYGVITLIR